MEVGILILLILVLPLFIIWFRTMTTIMATSESDFPGKYDKILWIIIFLVIPFLAPYLYSNTLKILNRKELKTEKQDVT